MNAADWFRKGLKVRVQMAVQRHPRLARALRRLLGARRAPTR